MGTIIPANKVINNIYAYGISTDSPSNHWVNLKNSPEDDYLDLGVLKSNAAFGNNYNFRAGQILTSDGGKLDYDGAINGKVRLILAIQFGTDESSAGRIDLVFIAVAFFMVTLFRKNEKEKKPLE
jgi:hypothetical protein